MRSIVHACLVPWTLVAIFTLAIPNPAHAADCEPLAAQAVSVQGTVESQAPGESTWIAVTINQAFCPGTPSGWGRTAGPASFWPTSRCCG
jgi:hypothetical protein